MGKLKIAIGWGAIALLLSLLLWGVGADVAFASIHTYADSPSTTVVSTKGDVALDDNSVQVSMPNWPKGRRTICTVFEP